MVNGIDLKREVERAYAVFDCYHLHEPLYTGDTVHKLTDERAQKLIATPKRQLSQSELAEYNSAITDCDVDQYAHEYRYFLPRLLDLVASGFPPDLVHGLPLCLNNLGRIQWRRVWRSEEVEVLSAFFRAFVKATLGAAASSELRLMQSAYDVVDTICFVASSGSDLDEALNEIDCFREPESLVFIALLRTFISRGPTGLSFNYGYLDLFPAAKRSVLQFVLRPEVNARIEACFFDVRSPELQQLLSDSLWAK